MTNKMKVILVAAVVMLGASGISLAVSCDMDSHSDQAYAQDAEKGSKAADIGNRVCPVSGETINESEKATYEYKGKIYNFCCSSCIPEFKKNPGKYITKIEQAAGGEHSMQEGHHH